MTDNQIILQAQAETSQVIAKIDKIIDEYLKKDSKLHRNQRLVNVGRALNAYHVAWIDNLKAQMEEMNRQVLGLTSDQKMEFKKEFIVSKPSKES